MGRIAVISCRLQDMDKLENSPHYELTAQILSCAFEVIQEMGSGFLEAVYKNSLLFALQHKGFHVTVEEPLQVYFRERKVGLYLADLIVEKSVIVELKCCRTLLPEHLAQVINYLKGTNLSVGLLINFGNKKLEYKRLLHPSLYPAADMK